MAAATVLRPCHSKRSSSSGRPWMGAAAPVAPGPAVLEAAPGPSGPAGACGPGGGWAGGGLPPSGDGAAMAAAPSAASARSWPERLLDVVFCPPCKIQAYGRHMTLGKPEKPGARNSHESPRRTEVQEACLAWRLSWRLAWPGLAWHRLHGLAWPHGLAWLGQARPRLASPRFASPRLASPASLALTCSGLLWPALAWPGLAWPGPARPGLAWPRLASPRLASPRLPRLL